MILAERYGFLGGNATAALVMPLMSFHTQHPDRSGRGATTLLPDRPRARRAGGRRACWHACWSAWCARAAPSRRRSPPATSCRSTRRSFKLVALDLLDEAGVRFLFHAFASGVVGERGT